MRRYPDRPSVALAEEELVWTFVRNEEHLAISRSSTKGGFLLGVSGDGPPRTYRFAERGQLEQFQGDFEKFLLASGWEFLAFSPDQRTCRERRHFSRLATDRRRWWTDRMRGAFDRAQVRGVASRHHVRRTSG